MLSIFNQEHFDKVLAKAKEMGLEEDLKEKLDYLDHYADDSCVCILGYDWAPLSFDFGMYKIDEKWQEELKKQSGVIRKNPANFGKFWFNGGLIYHGTVDGTYTDPLSVELCSSSKPHWSIHT